MAKPQRIEFRTVDGTNLRGDLYKVEDTKAPLVVMTQGLILLKEHYILSFAKRFQEAGYASLIYDHRGWGSSEGERPNEVNPKQQAEDYHDAVLFVQSLPDIDPQRICIWGIGHSGGAAMMADADDKNAKAAIVVMPFLSGKADAANFAHGTLEKARTDLMKTSGPAEYIQVWDNTEHEAQGDRNGILIHGPVPFSFISGAKTLSDAAGTPWQNRLTLRSLHHISVCEPQDHLPKISPKPLLHLAAIEDPLSGPLDLQEKAFATAGETKEFVLLQDNHIANYFGNFEANVGAQLAFLKKYV